MNGKGTDLEIGLHGYLRFLGIVNSGSDENFCTCDYLLA